MLRSKPRVRLASRPTCNARSWADGWFERSNEQAESTDLVARSSREEEQKLCGYDARKERVAPSANCNYEALCATQVTQ